MPNVGVKGLHLVAVVSPRSCIGFQGQYHLCGRGERGWGGMGCHELPPSSPRGGPGAVSAVDGQQPLCGGLKVQHESLSKRPARMLAGSGSVSAVQVSKAIKSVRVSGDCHWPAPLWAGSRICIN